LVERFELTFPILTFYFLLPFFERVLLSLWLQYDLFIRWLDLDSLSFEVLLELSQVRVVDEVLGITTRWDEKRFLVVDV